MSRFRMLSQTIWHCQYHIVWVPKYRFRILEGRISDEVTNYIQAFSEQQKCEIVELNVRIIRLPRFLKYGGKKRRI